MYSNKNSKAKSKRAQLSAKKHQKNANMISRTVDLDSQINLISSQQSSNNDNIEVVETHQQKGNKNSAQPAVNNFQITSVNCFNSFNYSRLSKTTPPPIQINPQFKPVKGGVIEIVVDDKPLNNNTEQSYKSYTFTREGEKEEFKIRDAFLSDFATKQVNSISKKPDIQKNDKKVLSQEMIEKIAQKKSRYFQVSHEICFKCNKEGHYAKNCINQDMRKCKICFSRLHDEHSCPQTCYQCGQSGHISNLCPYSKNQKCERCRQRGHTSSYCGVILRDRECISNIQSYFSQSDFKKMKCIIEEQHEKNCKKGPHFNCFVYKDWPMPYHQLRKTNSQNRNAHTSKSNNQKSSYRVHNQGYIFKPGQFQYRQEKRNNQHAYINRDNRFHSDNQRSFFYENNDHHNESKRWKNDEFQQYSRAFDDTKKRSREKWEKKGRHSNRDMYY